MGFDYTYLIYVLPAVLLSLWASSAVKSRFAEYDKVPVKKGVTGAEAAQILLRASGITDVRISRVPGSLTDNYNSGDKVLSLSDSTFSSSSVAAVGVAAHETGHAIQDKIGYGPLVLRHTLVPAANIGSRFGPVLAIAGIMFGGASQYASIGQVVSNIGIILFAGAVLFYLVTLPVEFDASRRALKILRETGVFDESELSGARKVLWAAAMTYVASALSAIGSLLRLMTMTRRRR